MKESLIQKGDLVILDQKGMRTLIGVVLDYVQDLEPYLRDSNPYDIPCSGSGAIIHWHTSDTTCPWGESEIERHIREGLLQVAQRADSVSRPAESAAAEVSRNESLTADLGYHWSDNRDTILQNSGKQEVTK